jgi:dihydropteroate synthase
MIATPSRSATSAASADHPGLRAVLSKPYPAVMGVLNVTPDSFSDGGQFIAPEQALAQAQRMIAEGADIIDIGAESTRPYGAAEPVSADEELKRLQPVLANVVALGIPVSIDSMKSAVVAWALDAGASIANDVWALQRDRYHAGYRRVFYEIAGDCGEGRHCTRPNRARSRHRLWQDTRAEHDRAGPAR